MSFDINNYEFYCNVCKTHVLECTKHCQACNRCVAKFDHHCPWLNNCIGGSNYNPFFKMLSTVTLIIAVQLTVAMLTLGYTNNFRPFSESDRPQIWIIAVTNLCVNAPVILGLLKLLIFHLYIMAKGLTTY